MSAQSSTNQYYSQAWTLTQFKYLSIQSGKMGKEQKEELTLMHIIKPLIATFFPFVWMGHAGLGLMYGLLGPAQPYIAK